MLERSHSSKHVVDDGDMSILITVLVRSRGGIRKSSLVCHRFTMDQETSGEFIHGKRFEIEVGDMLSEGSDRVKVLETVKEIME